MTFITGPDGTELYVRDWGTGRPVVLIHGWPLNGDSWEYQAVKLAENGHRVITYDRRGFGRSGQPFSGYDYDTMADDLAAVIDGLGLTDVALAGFSMGGGEVARYAARHGTGKLRAAVLISSVVPFMLKTPDNEAGVDESVFEEMKAGLRKDRPAFLSDFFKTFYGQGLTSGVSDGILHWSLMMAMQASPKATLDCVDAFGRTDFRADAGKIDVPALVIHGTEDKTVPIDVSGRRAAELIPDAQLVELEGPHGLLATHPEEITAYLHRFLG